MIDDQEAKEAYATLIEAVGIETAEALVEWYNVTKINMEDAERLIDLDAHGDFNYFKCANVKCPNHPDLVLYATPRDWGHFQGVNQSEYLGQLCGDCAADYLYLKQFADD